MPLISFWALLDDPDVIQTSDPPFDNTAIKRTRPPGLKLTYLNCSTTLAQFTPIPFPQFPQNPTPRHRNHQPIKNPSSSPLPPSQPFPPSSTPRQPCASPSATPSTAKANPSAPPPNPIIHPSPSPSLRARRLAMGPRRLCMCHLAARAVRGVQVW